MTELEMKHFLLKKLQRSFRSDIPEFRAYLSNFFGDLFLDPSVTIAEENFNEFNYLIDYELDLCARNNLHTCREIYNSNIFDEGYTLLQAAFEKINITFIVDGESGYITFTLPSGEKKKCSPYDPQTAWGSTYVNAAMGGKADYVPQIIPIVKLEDLEPQDLTMEMTRRAGQTSYWSLDTENSKITYSGTGTTYGWHLLSNYNFNDMVDTTIHPKEAIFEAGINCVAAAGLKTRGNSVINDSTAIFLAPTNALVKLEDGWAVNPNSAEIIDLLTIYTDNLDVRKHYSYPYKLHVIFAPVADYHNIGVATINGYPYAYQLNSTWAQWITNQIYNYENEFYINNQHQVCCVKNNKTYILKDSNTGEIIAADQIIDSVVCDVEPIEDNYELNIVYAVAPPSDTSKLWARVDEPSAELVETIDVIDRTIDPIIASGLDNYPARMTPKGEFFDYSISVSSYNMILSITPIGEETALTFTIGNTNSKSGGSASVTTSTHLDENGDSIIDVIAYYEYNKNTNTSPYTYSYYIYTGSINLTTKAIKNSFQRYSKANISSLSLKASDQYLFAHKSGELYIYKSDNSITPITVPIEQSIRTIYVNKDDDIIIIFYDDKAYRFENGNLIDTGIMYNYSWPLGATPISDFKGVLRIKSLTNKYINQDTYELASLPVTTDRVYSTTSGQTLPIMAYPVVQEADKIIYYYAGSALTKEWEQIAQTIKKHEVDISNICLLASNNGDKFNLGTNNGQSINLTPEALYIQNQKVPLYKWNAISRYWENIENKSDNYVIVETDEATVSVEQQYMEFEEPQTIII